MPGFSINGTGQGPSAVIETRRKHRWLFRTIADDQYISRVQCLILQSAQRPNFKLDEPEMHHNQEVAYFAGKQTWEPVTLTWYDAEQEMDVSRAIYLWLNSVVNLELADVAPPRNYKKQAELGMTSGVGYDTSETWMMHNCWPKEVNWGELDYTNTEICTIEVQMRYDRALKTQ